MRMEKRLAKFPPTDPRAVTVSCTPQRILVRLEDGRALEVPCAYFEGLAAASPAELREVRIFNHGKGLRWDGLDENLNVRGLLWHTDTLGDGT